MSLKAIKGFCNTFLLQGAAWEGQEGKWVGRREEEGGVCGGGPRVRGRMVAEREKTVEVMASESIYLMGCTHKSMGVGWGVLPRPAREF